jgi:hypothetical protein
VAGDQKENKSIESVYIKVFSGVCLFMTSKFPEIKSPYFLDKAGGII